MSEDGSDRTRTKDLARPTSRCGCYFDEGGPGGGGGEAVLVRGDVVDGVGGTGAHYGAGTGFKCLAV
jgi:hypothetical protein